MKNKTSTLYPPLGYFVKDLKPQMTGLMAALKRIQQQKMKNKITVALLVLGIGLVSCKKVYNYPESKKNELTVNNTITDKSLVSDNSVWTLVEVAPFSDPNNRYFKF